MTEAEFRKELKSSLSGAYLFYGGEEYLKKFYSKRAEELTAGDEDFRDFNSYTVIAAKDSPALGDLADAIMQLPMMSEKIFIRYNADLTAFTDKEITELAELLESVDPERTVLLIVTPEDGFITGDLKKNKPSFMFKTLSPVCRPVELSIQTVPELIKWMERRLSKDSLTISREGAEALINRSGKSMFQLSGELDKLAAYALANGLGTVTPETVSFVASVNEEDEAFALANAVLQGDRRKALKVLRLSKTAQQKAPAVLAAITRSICDMTAVCCLVFEGADVDTVAKKMKMHPYRAGLYVSAVKDYSPEKMLAAANRCREADLKLKSTRLDYIAIERLICTIPAKRRKM